MRTTMLYVLTIVSLLFAGSVPVSFSQNAQYYLENWGNNLPCRSGLLGSATVQASASNAAVNVQRAFAPKPSAFTEPILSRGRVLFSVTSNSTNVRIGVYDLTGRFVTDIFNGKLNSGNYSVTVDSHNVVPQTYILKVNINGFSHALKFSSIGLRSFSSMKEVSTVSSSLEKILTSTSNPILDLYDDTTASQQNNYEFQVGFEQPNSRFVSLFSSFVNTTNLQKQLYDSVNNFLIFVPSGDSVFGVASHYQSNSSLNGAALETIARGKVNLLLSNFWGRLEFDRTDITYQNGTNIVGVDVWFRRIFRNGIVLDNISAIVVSLNGAGQITSLRVKWPKFLRLSETNSLITSEFSRTAALNVISRDTSATKGIEQVKTISASINGLARAWHRILADNNILISPCLSFQTDFLMGNGEKATQFLNVPILAKYYSNK